MSTTSVPYTVRVLVTESGERMPLLIETATGQPLFDPTIFTVSQPRTRNLASATIEQILRAIMVLLLFCKKSNIDLRVRMLEGKIFDLSELDRLSMFCRLPLEEIRRQVADNQAKKIANIRSFPAEKVRMSNTKNKNKINEINKDGFVIRLLYIREYIEWLAKEKILKLSYTDPVRAALESCLTIATAVINGKISHKTEHSDDPRFGLDTQALEFFKGIINPEIADKPWRTKHGIQRNTLMMQWFLRLGLRRGELAGIKVGDIDFQENLVNVHRRADDKKDPRLIQPNAKTNARALPLDEDLAQLTREYVSGSRRNNRGARRHGFLFVATGTGAPIALRTINSVFEVLRKRWPDVFDDFSPHVIRHTFNDEFSRYCEENNINLIQAEEDRKELNGWSPKSKQPGRYTKRSTRKRTQAVSLKLQKKIVIKKGEKEV